MVLCNEIKTKLASFYEKLKLVLCDSESLRKPINNFMFIYLQLLSRSITDHHLRCGGWLNFEFSKRGKTFGMGPGISRTPNPASRDEKTWVRTHVFPKSRVPDARVFSCEASTNNAPLRLV